MMRTFAAVITVLGVASGSLVAQDGTLLVVNKSDSSLSFVDVATGEELGRVSTGFAPHEVAASADGRWAYVTDYGDGSRPGSTVTVVDVAGMQLATTIDLGPHTRPHGVTVGADGSVWVTTEGSAHVLRIDPETGTVETAVETGQETTHMVVVASDHGRAYTANIGSGTVTAVDVETGEVLEQIETDEGAEGLALSRDGARVYVANRAGTLTEIDVASNAATRSLEVGAMPIRVEVTPDGERALVSNANANEVAVVHLADWRVERRIPVGAVPVGIEILPDGGTAFVANTQADRISVLDLERWQVTGELVAGDEPDGMA
jgi:YVTN family beta-propeller protein